MQTTLKALRTAVPYIRAYKGRVFVVKLGGGLCEPGTVLDNIVEQLAVLYQLGIKLVVAHGGGEQVNAWCARLGITPRLVNGRRVTDDATLEIAKMVFNGLVNTNLIAAFRKYNVPAVGLTGIDGGLIDAAKRPPSQVTVVGTGDTQTVDFGHVGDIVAVRPAVLHQFLAGDYVPVVCSLAADAAGKVLNVNADTIASAVAIELGAAKYFLLTSVDGILREVSNPATLHPYLDIEQLDELIRSGVVMGGMLPKIAACVDALKGGVPRVHIINGTVSGTLLAEVFTNEGCGTLLVARRGEPTPNGPELSAK
jgi:acetylglutamate kinase